MLLFTSITFHAQTSHFAKNTLKFHNFAQISVKSYETIPVRFRRRFLPFVIPCGGRYGYMQTTNKIHVRSTSSLFFFACELNLQTKVPVLSFSLKLTSLGLKKNKETNKNKKTLIAQRMSFGTTASFQNSNGLYGNLWNELKTVVRKS